MSPRRVIVSCTLASFGSQGLIRWHVAAGLSLRSIRVKPRMLPGLSISEVIRQSSRSDYGSLLNFTVSIWLNC